MKFFNTILLISAIFLPLFHAAADDAAKRGVLSLENSLLKVGFIPELTGRIVSLELKKHPGDLIAPVTFVQVPLLPEMTVVCSNSNGGRVMNWEQGAFRANIHFPARRSKDRITMSGRVGDFIYSREFHLPPDSPVMYEKVKVSNRSSKKQTVSIWHQNCGLFSVASPAKFKNLIWYVPSSKVRNSEKSRKKSPARSGTDFPGIVEYHLGRENLGNNVSVNPCAPFMALTDRETQISVIWSMDKKDVDQDGFFNGWFGKLGAIHLASVEMISDEKLLAPQESAVWEIRHILLSGADPVNGVGRKSVISAADSPEGMKIKTTALCRIPEGKLVLTRGNRERKEFRIPPLEPGEIFSAVCKKWRLQPEEKLFLQLFAKNGILLDEFEVFWYKHKTFSSGR